MLFTFPKGAFSSASLVAIALLQCGQLHAQAAIGPANPYTSQCPNEAGPEPALIGPDASALIVGAKQPTSDAVERRVKEFRDYRAKFVTCVRKGLARQEDPLLASIFYEADRMDRRRPLFLPGSTEANFLPLIPLVGSKTNELLPLWADISGRAEDWKLLQKDVREALKRALKDEARKPGGRKPNAVFDQFRQNMRSGRYFGQNYQPSPAFREMLEGVADQLEEQYETANMAAELVHTRDEEQSALAERDLKAQMLRRLQQGADRLQTAQNVRAELARAADAVKADLDNQARQAADTAAPGRRAPYLLERDLFSDMSAKDRVSLFEAFAKATPQAQSSAPEFERVRTLSGAEYTQLRGRAQTQLDAEKFAKSVGNYAMVFGSLSAVNIATGAGNQDANRIIALGSAGSSALIEGAKILATPGLPAPIQAIAMLGVIGNFSTSLNGIFGSGGGQDQSSRQLMEALESLQRSLGKISSQIAYVQAFQEAKFTVLERKANQILAYGNRAFSTGFQQCRTTAQVLGPVRTHGRTEIASSLGLTGFYQKADSCNALLISASNTNGATYDDIMFDRVWSTSLAKIAPALQSDYGEYGRHFVDELYKQDYLGLADALIASRTPPPTAPPIANPDAKILAPFFVIARSHSETVEKLTAKMAKKVSLADEANNELGSLLSSLGSPVPSATGWTLRNFMANPIAAEEALTLAQSADVLADVLPYTLPGQLRPVTLAGGALPKSADFKQSFGDGVQRGTGLLLDYIPIAEQAVAQETMFAGDFLLPYVSDLVGTVECASLDPDDGSGTAADQTQRLHQISACNILRENPVFRQNFVMYRLKTAPAPKFSEFAAEYDMAFASVDSLHMRYMFGEKILSFDQPGASAPRFYYRISGNCQGLSEQQLNAMIGGRDKPEAPKSKADLLTSGATPAEYERSRLQVCVAAPMPDPADFQLGRFVVPTLLLSAESLRDKMVERTYRRAAVERSSPFVKPALSLAVGGL